MITNSSEIDRAGYEKGRRTKKFSTRLSEKYLNVLARLARDEGLSKTDILRRAIDLYAVGRWQLLTRLPLTVGAFSSEVQSSFANANMLLTFRAALSRTFWQNPMVRIRKRKKYEGKLEKSWAVFIKGQNSRKFQTLLAWWKTPLFSYISFHTLARDWLMLISRTLMGSGSSFIIPQA